MVGAVMGHLRNWFVLPNGIHRGSWRIEGGTLALPFLRAGQYFRVVGSVFNDGVYQYGDALALTDEEFTGEVWALAPPGEFLALAEEIRGWQEKHGAAAVGPYQSESFGGYSYTRASDAVTGGAVTWEGAFRGRLNRWRKL